MPHYTLEPGEDMHTAPLDYAIPLQEGWELQSLSEPINLTVGQILTDGNGVQHEVISLGDIIVVRNLLTGLPQVLRGTA